MPELFQKMAVYETVPDINPRNTVLDRRSEEQVRDDEQGVVQNSLNDKLSPYLEVPTILNSTHMGVVT